MAAHLSFKERDAFAHRLQTCLRAAGIDPRSPSQLRQVFQNTAPGKVISTSTAFKWLSGEALPDTRNMEVVARACGVCPDWLRTGRSSADSSASSAA